MKLLKTNFSIFIYSLLIFFFITFHLQDGRLVLLPAKNAGLSDTFLLIGLFIAYRLLLRCLPRHSYHKGFHILAWIISLFFSFASVMGVFYSTKNVDITSAVLAGPVSLIKAAAVFAGGAVLFYSAIRALDAIRTGLGNRVLPKSGKIRKAQDFLFGKNCFLKALAVLSLCWLPQVIIRYPGAVTTDSVVSLLQYYGVRAHTTQHPVTYTLLLGKFSDFGAAIGNAELGLFLLTLVQVAAFLLVLAYTVHTLKRLRVPAWCLSAALVIFAVSPVFVAYATTLVIDALYGAAFLLLMDELVYYVFLPEAYRKSWQHYLLTVIAVMSMFFRHNGIYIVAGVLVFMIVMELYLLLKKKEQLLYTFLVILALLLPMIGGKALNSHLYEQIGAKYVSTRAMLAVPMQQIARYMINHSDEIEKEDMAAIQKVMKWSPAEYEEKYNPLNFDGIKRGFNQSASKGELLDFLKVWFKLLWTHPDTYVNATLNQNYFLFSPLADNQRYYHTVRDGLQRVKSIDYSSVYQTNEVLSGLNTSLYRLYCSFTQLPFLGLLVNQGFYSIVLLGICLYALFDKNGRLLFLSVPLLLTLAIAFVGPACYGHPRYTYPIMYSMPLFFSIFAANCSVLLNSKIKR